MIYAAYDMIGSLWKASLTITQWIIIWGKFLKCYDISRSTCSVDIGKFWHWKKPTPNGNWCYHLKTRLENGLERWTFQWTGKWETWYLRSKEPHKDHVEILGALRQWNISLLCGSCLWKWRLGQTCIWECQDLCHPKVTDFIYQDHCLLSFPSSCRKHMW